MKPKKELSLHDHLKKIARIKSDKKKASAIDNLKLARSKRWPGRPQVGDPLP